MATDELDVDHASKQKQQREVDLRRALQEAEVDESLFEVVATMRALKSAKGDEGNSFGPIRQPVWCSSKEAHLGIARYQITSYHRVNAIPASGCCGGVSFTSGSLDPSSQTAILTRGEVGSY